MEDESCCVVLVTARDREEAERLAIVLVDEKLAACANLIGPITSIYVWQGERQRDEEWLLLIKTRRALFETLAARVCALHSYDTPEVIELPITAGSAPYLAWIAASTKSGRPD